MADYIYFDMDEKHLKQASIQHPLPAFPSWPKLEDEKEDTAVNHWLTILAVRYKEYAASLTYALAYHQSSLVVHEMNAHCLSSYQEQLSYFINSAASCALSIMDDLAQLLHVYIGLRIGETQDVNFENMIKNIKHLPKDYQDILSSLSDKVKTYKNIRYSHSHGLKKLGEAKDTPPFSISPF